MIIEGKRYTEVAYVNDQLCKRVKKGKGYAYALTSSIGKGKLVSVNPYNFIAK